MEKRKWLDPKVISMDRLDPAYGECDTGSTPVNDGTRQCQAGGGASTGVCSSGNGASSKSCMSGSGAKVICNAGSSR